MPKAEMCKLHREPITRLVYHFKVPQEAVTSRLKDSFTIESVVWKWFRNRISCK